MKKDLDTWTTNWLNIVADTRLVKICWIILVIFTFVCSLSKQYSQSGDIYQFAQMGEFRIILVIDGSFWWNNNCGDISHFTKSVGKSNRIHHISKNLLDRSGDILLCFKSVEAISSICQFNLVIFSIVFFLWGWW